MKLLEIFVIILVSLPFLGSFIVSFFRPSPAHPSAIFSAIIAAFCLGYTLILYSTVSVGGVLRYSIPFLPQFSLMLNFRLDGLSWLFCLLISGIGFLVIIYARYYLAPSDSAARFFCYFLAFMGSMIGVVVAGNLILMFIFWELTSVFSFLLIGFWRHNSRAREGARMALFVTFIGGISLFLSVIFIGNAAGSYDIDIVLNSKEKLLAHPYSFLILITLFIGAFTKSAQWPFHFWLPEAMTAPTPVSAYLHSATMVKAGIFLLARFWPIFSSTIEWFWILGTVGLITLTFGAYLAMFQKDIKALLAYSTISHLGLIMTLLSLGSPLACIAAVFHIINHATFKSSLFMAAGIIEHEAGTRDMRQLSGLFRAMPITASLALVAAAAMAGVPLLNGFLSKEMFFSEAAATHYISWLDTITPYIATLAGIFSVTYSIRFIHGIFFDGIATDLPKNPHEPPYFMRLPVEFLVLICILVGVFPNWTIKPLLETAVIAVLYGSVPTYSLALWHGWTAALWMSIVALAGGGVLYCISKERLKYRTINISLLKYLKARLVFMGSIYSLQKQVAPLFKKIFSTSGLQKQVRCVFILGIVLIVLACYNDYPNLIKDTFNPLSFWGLFLSDQSYQEDYLLFGFLWLCGSFCAIGLAFQAKFHRLLSIMLLSGTGLVTCITFLLFSAPDLALTQFLVEIVTTILLLLGLRWLPQRLSSINLMRSKLIVGRRRFIDFLIATIFGSAIGFLSYQMMNLPSLVGIKDYFLANAYPLGHGQNTVNVMLVDFRAFDTLGESTVLAIIALTIFALLRRFRPATESIEPPLAQRMHNHMEQVLSGKSPGVTLYEYLLLPSILVHWLFPFIVAMAFFLLLNGHNLPGGGFAAGITLTIGFILQYLVTSARWVEGHLRILPIRWMGGGLLLIFAVGSMSIILDTPFLKSHFFESDLPLLSSLPLNSVFLFDLGVFSVVVGALLLILIALAHQSIRGYRVRPFHMSEENDSEGEEDSLKIIIYKTSLKD